MLTLLEMNSLFNWLHEAPDCEWREDYCCFFILKGSKTHTWLALNHSDLFQKNPY